MQIKIVDRGKNGNRLIIQKNNLRPITKIFDILAWIFFEIGHRDALVFEHGAIVGAKYSAIIDIQLSIARVI